MLRVILQLSIAFAIPTRLVSPQETSNCRNWCDSHCGQVRLSKQCEFNDGNFKRIVGSKNDCPGFCLEDIRCNHFYWLGNTCYLKRTPKGNTTSTQLASESLSDSHKIATVCGFVVQRKEIPDPNTKSIPSTSTTSSSTSLPPISTTTEKTRASITIQPDVTRNWTVGHNGQLKYAELCEFSGGRILAERDGHIEQCGASCLADPRCTHFNTYSDYCYLMSITDGPAISEDRPDKEMHCGYIVNSTKPPVGKMKKRQIKDRKILLKEDFDRLDLDRWKHLVHVGTNKEFQFFTNRPENSFVRNGILHLKPTLTTATFGENFLTKGTLDLRPEGCTTSSDGCIISPGDDILKPIQSARISSEKSFYFSQGSVEIRAKMPKGDWIQASIWLVPTENPPRYGDYPRSGKVSIAESRGNSDYSCWNVPLGRQLVGSSLHWGPDPDLNGIGKTLWSKVNQTEDFSSSFHIYRLDRLADGIRFFIDGELIGQVSPPEGGFWQLGGFNSKNNIWSSGTKMAPFDRQFHFVLGVSVGGSTFFPEGCVNQAYPQPWSTSDPNPNRQFWSMKDFWIPTWKDDASALQIDYIRVYALL